MVSKVFHHPDRVAAKEIAGFVKHLTAGCRVPPRANCCGSQFRFRSCGQLCGCGYCDTQPGHRLQRNGGQTACKPGSVRTFLVRDGHSSGTRLAARLTRPTRAAERKRPCPAPPACTAGATRPPLFGLAPGGVYRAAPVARDAVRSYRTVSPLPAGPVSLATPGPCAGGLLSVALSLGSPPPAVSRHRVPVEPGLSSTLP